MKFIFILSLFFVSTAKGEVRKYTGSTPAGPVVRSFLGIALPDSVDFIRWQITFENNHYTLNCNYGIGKPNTNGFINGGKQISIEGMFSKETHIYMLNNAGKSLDILELNADLLHLLDAGNSMLIGNGGWSYTLNNTNPSVTDAINIVAKKTVFKDSIAFQGRTPCSVPGVIPGGKLCYKLKWYIVLYTNNETSNAGTCRILGTAYRSEGRRGTWKTINGKNGNIIYELDYDKENAPLYVLQLNGNILVFTDAHGKLLVGNEDFSYTMNRVAYKD